MKGEWKYHLGIGLCMIFLVGIFILMLTSISSLNDPVPSSEGLIHVQITLSRGAVRLTYIYGGIEPKDWDNLVKREKNLTISVKQFTEREEKETIIYSDDVIAVQKID